MRTDERFRDREKRRLPKDVLERLHRLSPARTALSIARTFGLGIGSVLIAAAWPHPLIIVIALIGAVGAQHGLAVLAHQAAHYRLYENRWLNDLVGRACALPIGLSMISYRALHRVHHNHLYSDIDPDLPLMAGYPRGRAYLLKKLSKDALGLTTLKNYGYFLGARNNAASPAQGRAARRDRVLLVLVHALALPLLIATGAWKPYLLFWAVPALTIFPALLRLRAVCEHGAVPDETQPHRASRTTIVPAAIAWFLFPHAMNYHVEHHLYPGVPHYRLAELHRELRARGHLDDAEVVTSLRETLRKIFRDPAPRRGSESRANQPGVRLL